jgi:hypothetical protein
MGDIVKLIEDWGTGTAWNPADLHNSPALSI